jgi:hypothetical protein
MTVYKCCIYKAKDKTYYYLCVANADIYNQRNFTA